MAKMERFKDNRYRWKAISRGDTKKQHTHSQKKTLLNGGYGWRSEHTLKKYTSQWRVWDGGVNTRDRQFNDIIASNRSESHIGLTLLTLLSLRSQVSKHPWETAVKIRPEHLEPRLAVLLHQTVHPLMWLLLRVGCIR